MAAAAVVGAVAAAFGLLAKLESHSPPRLYNAHKLTPEQKSLLVHMPTILENYTPYPLLRNPHVARTHWH